MLVLTSLVETLTRSDSRTQIGQDEQSPRSGNTAAHCVAVTYVLIHKEFLMLGIENATLACDTFLLHVPGKMMKRNTHQQPPVATEANEKS